MPDLLAEGRAALAALDRALAAEPVRDPDAFTATTERLCHLRTLLIAARDGSEDRTAQLGQVNAIISSTLAGHYPIGPVPWPLVRSARESLESLLTKIAR